MFHYLFVEGVTKIGVEKFEVMEEDEVDELSSATGPQRCKFFSWSITTDFVYSDIVMATQVWLIDYISQTILQN